MSKEPRYPKYYDSVELTAYMDCLVSDERYTVTASRLECLVREARRLANSSEFGVFSFKLVKDGRIISKVSFGACDLGGIDSVDVFCSLLERADPPIEFARCPFERCRYPSPWYSA